MCATRCAGGMIRTGPCRPRRVSISTTAVDHDAEDAMFLKRVVLGIDFSDASLGTARWAARHLAPDAELALVHVIPLAPPPGFLRREPPGSEHVLEHVREATRQGLQIGRAS